MEGIIAFLYGSGSGDGHGNGSGFSGCLGDGSGFGGSGFGRGCGGHGINKFCGAAVYEIDKIPTIIDNIHRNVARGRIINEDLTTTPCWVVKQDNTFAHGKTLHKAMDALRDKLFDSASIEERIKAFVEEHEQLGKAYPCSDLCEWHRRLTGSCEIGREEFARSHGIDLKNDSMTVEQFIELTCSAYGGAVIRKLREAYQI